MSWCCPEFVVGFLDLLLASESRSLLISQPNRSPSRRRRVPRNLPNNTSLLYVFSNRPVENAILEQSPSLDLFPLMGVSRCIPEFLSCSDKTYTNYPKTSYVQLIIIFYSLWRMCTLSNGTGAWMCGASFHGLAVIVSFDLTQLGAIGKLQRSPVKRTKYVWGRGARGRKNHTSGSKPRPQSINVRFRHHGQDCLLCYHNGRKC